MTRQYKRKDHLYNQAKSEGYRSRAAYKLAEIAKKYKILQPGDYVLDLGAWPGSWIQVAREAVGPKGLIVGVDLTEIEDFNDPVIKVLTGDVADCIERALQISARRFDVVLSDMAPKLTGIREADQMASAACAELALWSAQQALVTGGHLVVKVFKGNEVEQFVKTMRPLFNQFIRSGLDSSRTSSSETYVIGLQYKA